MPRQRPLDFCSVCASDLVPCPELPTVVVSDPRSATGFKPARGGSSPAKDRLADDRRNDPGRKKRRSERTCLRQGIRQAQDRCPAQISMMFRQFPVLLAIVERRGRCVHAPGGQRCFETLYRRQRLCDALRCTFRPRFDKGDARACFQASACQVRSSVDSVASRNRWACGRASDRSCLAIQSSARLDSSCMRRCQSRATACRFISSLAADKRSSARSWLPLATSAVPARTRHKRSG